MKALLLGAGEMARVALRDLIRFGTFQKIIVATRRPECVKAILAGLKRSTRHVSARRLDVTQSAALVALMREVDVVVNCVGPNYKYEVPIARAAIRARVSLVDLNDDYETTLEMYELDAAARKAGITIIMGLGASPGVNNVLARAGAEELDEVEEIHTAWIMSGTDAGGPALSYHLLHSLSGKALTLRDGRMLEVRSFVDGWERMEFPDPVGPMEVFHIGHPEALTLSRSFPGLRYADDKASFNPPLVNEWIVRLGAVGRGHLPTVLVGGRAVAAMDFAAAYLHQSCKRLKGISREGALRVGVIGRKGEQRLLISFAAAGRIAEGTGIPASIGAQMIVAGKISRTGVLPPELCIDPGEFVQEIYARDIGDIQRSVVQLPTPRHWPRAVRQETSSAH